MPDPTTQDAATTPGATAPVEPLPGTYAMSREGRRQAIILLIGVASIWVFALWTLVTVFQDGVTGVEWISGLLMLAILVVAPVVAWALLEEARSAIRLNEKGIRYSTLAGINLEYGWSEVSWPSTEGRRNRWARFFLGNDEEKPAAEVESEEGTDIEGEVRSLNTSADHTAQIANPVARLLHRLAHGSSIPLYAGLENRESLVEQINEHIK